MLNKVHSLVLQSVINLLNYLFLRMFLVKTNCKALMKYQVILIILSNKVHLVNLKVETLLDERKLIKIDNSIFIIFIICLWLHYNVLVCKLCASTSFRTFVSHQFYRSVGKLIELSTMNIQDDSDIIKIKVTLWMEN